MWISQELSAEGIASSVEIESPASELSKSWLSYAYASLNRWILTAEVVRDGEMSQVYKTTWFMIAILHCVVPQVRV